MFRDDSGGDNEEGGDADDAVGHGGTGGDWEGEDEEEAAEGSDGGEVLSWEERLFGRGYAGDASGGDGGGASAGGGGELGSGGGAFGGAATALLDGAGAGNALYDALRGMSGGPDDVERLKMEVSEDANDAFRRTVVGIVGALPSDAYEVTITSDRAGLSRLMHSSLCTGYALRNAEVRLTLNNALNDALATGKSNGNATGAVGSIGDGKRKTAKRGRPSKKVASSEGESKSSGSKAEPDYMSSVPFRGKVDSSGVSGDVSWWSPSLEARQEMSGAEYVSKLESENELLRDRIAASESHDKRDGNRILQFMKTLSMEKITTLQQDISSLAEDAFRQILSSVLGEVNSMKMQTTYSTSRDYLGQITLWCLLAGYMIRNMEKRHEMQTLFASTESLDSSVPATPSSPPSSSSSPAPPEA